MYGEAETRHQKAAVPKSHSHPCRTTTRPAACRWRCCERGGSGWGQRGAAATSTGQTAPWQRAGTACPDTQLGPGPVQTPSFRDISASPGLDPSGLVARGPVGEAAPRGARNGPHGLCRGRGRRPHLSRSVAVSGWISAAPSLCAVTVLLPVLGP